MSKESPTTQQPPELVLELYKSLRSEASVYIEKVPALWLQKFILIGTLLAFLLTQKKSFDVIGAGDPAELAFDIALVAIVVIAGLLDAKIMEYGLHARVISRFIEDEFSSHAVIGRWEQTLWGYSDRQFQRNLVKLRSTTTVLVTVVPTVLIIVLDAVLIYGRRQDGWILIVGAVSCVVYVAATVVVVRGVWPASSGDATSPQQ
ncbi:hypothetical protein GCM10027053_26240 [Intrasporangium mesophilum]